MTSLGYVSDRLKTLACKKKALLKEQAKKEEQFRCLEEERQAVLEIERNTCQETQDFLMTQQVDNDINNMHISGGNNSPPLIPPESP